MIDKRILISLVENVSQNSKAKIGLWTTGKWGTKIVVLDYFMEYCYIHVQINIGLTYFN